MNDEETRQIRERMDRIEKHLNRLEAIIETCVEATLTPKITPFTELRVEGMPLSDGYKLEYAGEEQVAPGTKKTRFRVVKK